MQDIIPGRSWYHTGSYALLIVALSALMLWRLRKAILNHDRSVPSLIAISAGASAIALTGLASGLLGPDTQTYIAPPGASMAILEPAGHLQFPFDVQRAANVATVFRATTGREVTVALYQRRYIGAFILWSTSHPVAFVTAQDDRGRRLTITQPANPSFLSPVLVFPQTARIGGRILPVDSFSVPALQRIVKAVLFSADTLTKIQNRPASSPALLIAVEDERGRLLPGAMRLLPSGRRLRIDALTVGALIADYPQVVVAAAPALNIFLPGVAMFVVGLIWCAAFRIRFRS